MNRLAGKVAFVTGGGSGIARAASLLFALEGARVVVAEIDAALGAATADAVVAAGGDAVAVHTDVTDEHSVRASVVAAVARYGRLDILFNCAGGSLNADSQVTDVDLAVWDRTMALDVRGAMLVCRHGIPELVKAGGGSVVNMSSGAALRGSSPKHVYTAAKGAILSFTRALAGSYAKDNIRANAICAGRILTDRILNNYGTADAPGPVADRQDAAGRVRDYPFWVGRPEDIANIALFLASDESRMITGATIPADGGRSAY
jgi:NAD(P)-dependent dehydrogenase (short-subunit alcohol dehydrogenase family)